MGKHGMALALLALAWVALGQGQSRAQETAEEVEQAEGGPARIEAFG